MKNIKINITLFLLIVCIVLSQIVLLPTICFAKSKTTTKLPKIESNSAVVINAANGNILFEQKANSTIYPASTSKMLTAIVAIENSNLDEDVLVSLNALEGQANGGAHIALEKGEIISMEDALYGLLLTSANDCAIAIAEHISGSEEEFAGLLNAKGKEIGLQNSNFVTASGLFDKNHYTTVADLAKITDYAIKNPTFLKIFSTLIYTVPPTNKCKEERVLRNSHRMLKYKSYEYEGVIGGKRGYITESRFNMITYAKRDNTSLICVVAKGDSQVENLEDTTNLFNYYFDNYKGVYPFDYINKDDILDDITNSNRIIANSKFENDFYNIIVENDADLENLTYKIEKIDDLTYPIEPNTVVGKVNLFIGNEKIESVNLIEKTELRSIASNIMHTVLLVSLFAFLIVLISIVAFTLYKQSKKRNNYKRKKRKKRKK